MSFYVDLHSTEFLPFNELAGKIVTGCFGSKAASQAYSSSAAAFGVKRPLRCGNLVDLEGLLSARSRHRGIYLDATINGIESWVMPRPLRVDPSPGVPDYSPISISLSPEDVDVPTRPRDWLGLGIGPKLGATDIAPYGQITVDNYFRLLVLQCKLCYPAPAIVVKR